MNTRWLCGALGVILLIGVIVTSGRTVRIVPRRRALVVFRRGRPSRCRGPGTRLVAPAWEQAEEIRTGPRRWDGDFTCYSGELFLVAVRVELEYEVVDVVRFEHGATVVDGRLSDIVGATIDAQLVSRPLAWTIGHPDEVERAVAERVTSALPAIGVAARSVRVHRPRVSPADLKGLQSVGTRRGPGNDRAPASTNGRGTPPTNGGRPPANGRSAPWPRPTYASDN